MKLIYSSEAVEGLVRLRRSTAQHDPSAASRTAQELVIRIEPLLTFPGMGRPVPQSPEPGSVRDFVSSAYVVRYAVHPSALAVLRIWHHFEQQRSR